MRIGMCGNTKSILVPVDFTEASRHAIANAAELGEKLKYDLFLVNFIPPSDVERNRRDETVERLSGAITSSLNLLKENENKMAELVQGLGKYNVTVHSEIKMDKLARGIKKQLKTKDVGLVVIGFTDAHTIGDSFCNTQHAKELINIDCPIMICNGHHHEFNKKHKIIVSLDFDDLNTPNIDKLTSFARNLSCKVYYMHVNHPDDKCRFNEDAIEQYLRKHNIQAKAIEVVDSENKEEAIKSYADKKKADLIAISRFSKSSDFKKCHAEQVVEKAENLVFIY